MDATTVKRFLDRDLEPHFHDGALHRHAWGAAPHGHKPSGGMVYDRRFVKRKVCDVVIVLCVIGILVVGASMAFGRDTAPPPAAPVPTVPVPMPSGWAPADSGPHVSA